MTFFDLDWLNKAADGVICVRCDFVRSFMGVAHRWVRPGPGQAGGFAGQSTRPQSRRAGTRVSPDDDVALQLTGYR